MEKTNKMNIEFSTEFSSALSDIVEQNPSFDSGKLRIAYTGRNRNNTFISKQAFERAIPTMFNCPVVANYIREDNEIGSHDGEIVSDGETKKYVNITQPVGVIPESASWYWEDINDGNEYHEYLCTDVLLWKRQEAYEKIKSNGITKQSMEIEVRNGETVDGYYDIKDFIFNAFCLLGTAEPCFESAALMTFNETLNKKFEEEYAEMLKEFKEAFADIGNKKGERNLNRLNELLEKYSVTEDMLQFSVEGLTDEELEEKFVNQFELDSNIRESLINAVTSEKIEEEWGSYPRRRMVDYDMTINEIYYIDYNNNYRLYGAPFRYDGDNIIVDFDHEKRKKFTIVDYIEGTEEPNSEDSIDVDFGLSDIIDNFKNKYTDTVNEFNTKVNDFETQIKDLTETAEPNLDIEEFERLKKFEAETLASIRANKESEILEKFSAQFSELGEYAKFNKEFESLKEHASDYELDVLEEKLYALAGKAACDSNVAIREVKNTEKIEKPVSAFINIENESGDSNDGDNVSNFMNKYLKK